MQTIKNFDWKFRQSGLEWVEMRDPGQSRNGAFPAGRPVAAEAAFAGHEGK